MKGLLLKSATTGEHLEMIYLSAKGEITQRIIRAERIGEESFKAYCFTRRQSRTFKISNVLSIAPIRHHRRGA
ncbi:hypothetical protein B5V89_05240 [Heyndrickxia sporothermodurans]|uniref:hypothetical protein n=1 Tax=Heyndrickxia TaxID=2837504 RepID=UPI000D3AE246|nr:hypothetical protein [Heyndrickxia sporothermodurans]PTY79541.1 hypothetical protein B5V89_05240 [Heyndrickxia sporothermodurans]